MQTRFDILQSYPLDSLTVAVDYRDGDPVRRAKLLGLLREAGMETARLHFMDGNNWWVDVECIRPFLLSFEQAHLPMADGVPPVLAALRVAMRELGLGKDLDWSRGKADLSSSAPHSTPGRAHILLAVPVKGGRGGEVLWLSDRWVLTGSDDISPDVFLRAMRAELVAVGLSADQYLPINLPSFSV